MRTPPPPPPFILEANRRRAVKRNATGPLLDKCVGRRNTLNQLEGEGEESFSVSKQTLVANLFLLCFPTPDVDVFHG